MGSLFKLCGFRDYVFFLINNVQRGEHRPIKASTVSTILIILKLSIGLLSMFNWLGLQIGLYMKMYGHACVSFRR
jgi:hypothetical protein